MKFKDKIAAIFAKAQDEAMNLAKDAEGEEKKDDKAKDAGAEEKESKDAKSYDDIMKAVNDLGEMVKGMVKQKDASTKATENEPAKVDAKDDEGGESSMEDRLKALEAAVAKLLESKAAASDEEGEESEESEDDDFEESTMTGDTASRVEILAPGLKAKGKDAKAQALKAAYATKDGKAAIDKLTGNKAPDLKDESRVDTLFIAASELLKVSRASELSSTKQSRATDSSAAASKGAPSAEELNAIHAKHYGNK